MLPDSAFDGLFGVGAAFVLFAFEEVGADDLVESGELVFSEGRHFVYELFEVGDGEGGEAQEVPAH